MIWVSNKCLDVGFILLSLLQWCDNNSFQDYVKPMYKILYEKLISNIGNFLSIITILNLNFVWLQSQHCTLKNKVIDFSIPCWDVTYQTLPGRE